jgi:hypothetical protein
MCGGCGDLFTPTPLLLECLPSPLRAYAVLLAPFSHLSAPMLVLVIVLLPLLLLLAPLVVLVVSPVAPCLFAWWLHGAYRASKRAEQPL